MNRINIDGTDIFLENIEFGQGKITISDGYRGAFTHYWGSMGDTIEDFICRINSDYFADKLCTERSTFSAKKTLRNLRSAIKEELPWYIEMEAQKELREKIRDLESCSNEHEFVAQCSRIPKSLYFTHMEYYDEKRFIENISEIFTCEPWGYIEVDESYQYKWLKGIHNKLKKELNKSVPVV